MKFTAIIAIEGIPTGDGRELAPRSLAFESNQPYPLRFKPDGTHDGIVVGTISRVWRSGSEIRAEGDLHLDSADPDVTAAASRVAELAEEGLAGLSVGMDDQQVEIRVRREAMEVVEVEEPAEPETTKDGRVVVARWKSDDELAVTISARLREVSVTDQPAIVGTGLTLERAPVAAAGGLMSIDAFANPRFGPDGDTDVRLAWQKPLRKDEGGHWGAPLTVTRDGRIFGHLATKGRCHASYSDVCMNLDALDPTYSFDEFLIGEAVPGIRTGPIVLNTSHSVRADGTMKSWDWLADTGEAVADVSVGVDQHGIWVAGRTRPGITPAQLAALKGSALSGEWTPSPSKMGLRLSGILAVNGPGFAIARRPVAAANGVYSFGPAGDCGCTDKKELSLREALHQVRQKALSSALERRRSTV